VAEVILVQRALVDDRVEGVAPGFWPAVHRVVLDGRDRFQVLRVVPLQSPDELDSEVTGKERVLAVGLLPASPSWVPKEVDVR
jgi:hypothetical protein